MKENSESNKDDGNDLRSAEEGLVKAKNPHISPESAQQIEEDLASPTEVVEVIPFSSDDVPYSIDAEDPKHVKILHSAKKLHWSNILANIIMIQDNNLWRICLLSSLYVDYFCKTYSIAFMKLHGTQFVYTVGITSSVLFFVNYVWLVTTFFWKKLHLIIVHRKKGAIRLIFDGFFVLPWATIFYWITNEESISVTYFVLSCFSFFRLYYAIEFFGEKSGEAGVEHWNYFVARYILQLLWFTHMIACILYLLACPIGCKTTAGWGYVFTQKYAVSVSDYVWYIFAFYMGFMSLSNVGYGEFLATNHDERLVLIITMTYGFALTTLILIGALSSDIVNKSNRLANLRIQLDVIKAHLKNIGMSQKNTDLIMNYYRLFWKKKKGVKASTDINLLPLPLQMEISFDINYYLLQCSLMFKNKPEPFLRTLSLNMKHEFFQPGEVIFKYNAIKYKMILVASGIIEITSDEDYDSPIISFGRGSVLGEAALILTLPSKTTVRAANYCELQVLYKVDFVQIIKLYPDIYLQLREAILTRIEYFRQDEYKIEFSTKFETLNLYVSQKMKLSAIKRVKNRLLKEYFVDVIPPGHHSCDLYRYERNVKKKKGKYICLTSTMPWIMNPRSSFLRVWEIIVLIDVLAICIIYPYFISYHREFPQFIVKISILLEIVYYLDIYIILTTAIEGKDYMVKTLFKIIEVHMRSLKFYVEIFATLPIEYLLLHRSSHIYYTVKVNRLLKFYRVCTYFSKRESQLLTENIFTLRLCKYLIYIVMVNYWFGVMLYSSTCFEPSCERDGWYRQHLLKDHLWRLTTPCSSYPTLMSIYYGLTVLSTLGFDDIGPKNKVDLLLMILGVVLGIFLFGYCTAELSATITYLIQMKTDFQSSMFAVEKFLVDNNMDLNIKERVMRFLELQWYYNKGVYFWKTSILENAPQNIQKDVTVKECMDAICSIPFFQNVDKQFVEMIAMGARIIVLPPGEIITYPGSSSRDMYIVQQGFCSKESEPGMSVMSGPGEQFGLRNILWGWPNLYRITTITHVKIIAISDSVYTSAISLFPEEYAIIQKSLPPENLQFLAEMKSYWGLWNLVSSSMMPEKQFRRKMKFKEWVITAFKESFIYVPTYCDNNGEDYDEPFLKFGYLYKLKYFVFPFCILPQGWFLKIWVGVRLTAAILLALFIPYQVVQFPHISETNVLMILLDVIAYIDLLLMMSVGYYGKMNQLIIHPCKTAAHYLKSSFIIDLLLCFPWGLLLDLFSHSEDDREDVHSSHSFLHSSLNMIKIFQVYRLPKFFTYLEENIRVSGLYIQVIKFVPFTLIFLNGCTALIVITSCKYLHKSEVSEDLIVNDIATPPGMGSKKIQEYTMFCKQDCWIERSKFQEFSDPMSIYMLAAYFSTTTLVGAGFGDLTAQDPIHLIIISIMMMCGTFYFGYVFAYVSSYTSDLHSIFSMYQGMVAELKRYFEIESVPKQEGEIVLANAAYRWNRSEGMEPNKILSIVHPALHEDALLHLYENTLKQIPLFEGVDRTFFRIIGKALNERYYIKGSYLFTEDDVIDSIYIVHRGKLQMKFYHNFYEEMVTYIGIGGMLGNIGNHVKSRMLSTAIASTNMDTLFMKTEDFYRILNKYPEVKKKIDISFAREEHQDFCVPLTMIEEEADSMTLEGSVTSEEPKMSTEEVVVQSEMHSSSSSDEEERRRLQSSQLHEEEKIIRSPWLTLWLIFMPNLWFNKAILPDSNVLYAIVVLCAISAYFNCILVMYQFAFQDFQLWTIMVLLFIDIINIWNIFLELHTAYMDRYSEYVVDNKRIKRRYFANKFRRTIDFVANFPIQYVAFLLPVIFGIPPYKTFSFLKLISLLRITSIRDFFNSKRANLMLNRLMLKLISVFIWLSMTIHIFSCVWYLFACPIFFCYKESWVKVFYEKPRSQFEIYIICVYFIMWVSTNTGIGDIVPERKPELLFLTILMLTTKFVIGIFIGMAANIMSLHSSVLTRYEARIYELRDYLRNENVSEHQMEKMWNYVKLLWSKRSGRQIPTLIIETMSYTNQSGLKFLVYGDEMMKSYLFHDLGESFLRQLSYHIRPVMFFPGNYIVQNGDSDQSMYFVHRGEVDVLTVHSNLTETIHDILQKGEMFGLPQGLFYGIPHQFSYRAKTTVDIGVLILKDWIDIMMLFPRAKEIIYKRASIIYTIL